MVAAADAKSAPDRVAETGQYVTFHIGPEEFGVPVLRTREIIRYEPPTRVPGAPAAVRGVINLRGSVLPVVDLGIRFGLAACTPSARTCIVVLELDVDGEVTRVGILADSVSEVLDLAASDIDPTPSFGTAVREGFLRGVGKVGRKFLLLLDLDRAFTSTDLFAVEMPAPVVPASLPAAAPEPRAPPSGPASPAQPAPAAPALTPAATDEGAGAAPAPGDAPSGAPALESALAADAGLAPPEDSSRDARRDAGEDAPGSGEHRLEAT